MQPYYREFDVRTSAHILSYTGAPITAGVLPELGLAPALFDKAA